MAAAPDADNGQGSEERVEAAIGGMYGHRAGRRGTRRQSLPPRRLLPYHYRYQIKNYGKQYRFCTVHRRPM